MDDKLSVDAGRTNARSAILAAARAQIADTGDFTVNAVAARAGISRQAVQYHFGGARGLRQALAAEGLLPPDTDEPTRERLIDAAARLFSRPDGADASIEEIAAEAGMSKGAIYHYFADRTEFLRAVAGRISPVDELVAVLDATQDAPLRDGLVALAAAYYAAMRARVGLIRSLAANASSDPELATVVMSEIVGRGAPHMFEWFGRRVARGELRPVHVPFVVQALFGPVFLAVVVGEHVFEAMQSAGIRAAIDHVEEYVDFLLAGIAPEGSPVPAAAHPALEPRVFSAVSRAVAVQLPPDEAPEVDS